MGLFKKRATDPAEMEQLKSEIAAMSARLDEADAAKHELGERILGLGRQLGEQHNAALPAPTSPQVSPADLDVLRARIQRLSDRIDGSAVDPTGAGADELGDVRIRLDTLAQRLDDALENDAAGSAKSIEPPEMEYLRDRIEVLDARIEAAVGHHERAVDHAAFDDLRDRVDALTTRFDTPLRTPPPPEPPPAPSPVAEGDGLRDIHERLDAIGARLDDVDQRITSISTELANQITEISGELDAVGAGGPAAEHVIDELRDAQTRIANEQVRYQIAFRQDLADLADRLKRS